MLFNAPIHLIKITILGCVLLGLSYLFTRQTIAELPLNTLYTTQCSVAKSQGTQVFSVYMPTNLHVDQLAHHLCTVILKGSVYNQVQVSWQPRELLNSDTILKQTYNVMLNREYALTGLLPNWQAFYSALLHMPSYHVYWYSQQDNLVLSLAYLKSQRIGLLEDKKSESGYLAPMSEISRKGININQLNISYYPNRETLMNDFLAHKLDIITAVAQTNELVNWPSERKKLLKSSSKITWYLSLNTDRNVALKMKVFLSSFQQKILSSINSTATGN